MIILFIKILYLWLFLYFDCEYANLVNTAIHCPKYRDTGVERRQNITLSLSLPLSYPTSQVTTPIPPSPLPGALAVKAIRRLCSVLGAGWFIFV